ncbi:D-ribose pyranase [Neobacillus sp. WH10]|uniref:D-ribose pyranase n=1 Tax=Neobacillus sp. WH10 TaxID=3047873 RepID=UPI0024C112EA|nr:D-ribose pyranase [Neobacillus sp. WH10]WHY77148.1 D-ribose pyranase [Neobacillus sp. WH10]
MKKIGVINSEISSVLAKLGHTDSIVIGDCGLPIPEQVKRIDLALKLGVPSFIETLDTVLEEMQVESIVIAEEISSCNKKIEAQIKERFPNIVIEYVPHKEFKSITRNAKAIIRTGEATPYANIILKSGVVF